MIGKYCIIRTAHAGVHVGTLAEHDGDAVTLTGGRIVWRWRGAYTLHEMSLHGIDAEYSRVSEAVPEIVVKGVISIIPCSDQARAALDVSRWAQ